jgi:carboxypeptidase Q
MTVARSASKTILLLSLVLCLALPAGANDGPNLEVVHRIKREAFDRSEVMKHLFYLTDVYGPRLTGSPGYDDAAQWVVDRANEWGLSNAALEPWGPFGRGWSASYFSAHLLEPRYSSLIGVPLAWSPGTEGVVRGVPVLAPIPRVLASRRDADLDAARRALDTYIERWRGKLEGSLVLLRHPRHLDTIDEAPSRRFTSEQLATRTKAPDPSEPIDIDPDDPVVPEDPYDRGRFSAQLSPAARLRFRERRNALLYELNRFLVDEGVRLVIHPSAFGDGGTIFPPRVARHPKEAIDPPPSIALTPEHYNRMARLLQAGVSPVLEVEVRAQFHDSTLDSTNVVAEIPGGSRADELVLIGAHLDDVSYATGATDNAAGCAVMMEVMRILKTLDLELARTVRMVLWSGEEQGLLGSRAYVAKHFGDSKTGVMLPDHGNVSAYYNLDNGTGKIRGIYLQGNDLVRPVFSAWLAPFRDLGATTISIRKTFGTDHLAFDAVGLPGFQFVQDPVEYGSRTHHSNMDVYDRVQAADLMQASAIIASFVYQTANRPELLPRKPGRL